ncbi:MAG TPA: hypothetical protein VHF22_02035, partial [Planctomycetota bacterium]|nr:hypothetical protein [Planctomycetota bacterium]
VLDAHEWREVALEHVRKYREKHPERRAEVDANNVANFPDEPFVGVGVFPDVIADHEETWDKISRAAALPR